MTCLELETRTYREGCIPVLETERLILRAPHLEDANAVAMLANDRRVAEKTARLPPPLYYSRHRAKLLQQTATNGGAQKQLCRPSTN